MVSPEYVDTQKPEDKQAPSPAEGKEGPTGVKEIRPWLKPLLQTVGVIVTLIGGFAWMWVIQWANNFSYVGIPIVLLLPGLCAAFFRSWWAMLFLPLALVLGELLAFFVGVVYFNYPYAFNSLDMKLALVGGFVLAILAAVPGSLPAGESWKRKRRQK